jgi:hypothetical protein
MSFEIGELVQSGVQLVGHGVNRVEEAVTNSVVLFTFGAVLLALVGERMEKLELELAARPARTFALGVVSFFAGVVIAAALCVTIIGIPFAMVGLIVAVIAGAAGIVATLAVVGNALIGHRTKNRYLHLALGCAILLVAGNLPWLGELVTFVAICFGLGSVIASRAGGLIRSRAPRYAT